MTHRPVSWIAIVLVATLVVLYGAWGVWAAPPSDRMAAPQAEPETTPASVGPWKLSGAQGAQNMSPQRQAAPSAVLYDQYNNDSNIVTQSQNFETINDAYDTFLADDFVVPANQSWSITSVELDGGLYSGTQEPASFNLFFYANTVSNLPGALVASRTGLAYNRFFTNYEILISPAVELGPGVYWMSVQANLDYEPEENLWGWSDRMVQSNNGAAFQNPGGGWSVCPSWCRRGQNIPNGGGPDQTFRLLGSILPTPTATDRFGNPTATRTPTRTSTIPPTITLTPTATRTPTSTSTPGITSTPTPSPTPTNTLPPATTTIPPTTSTVTATPTVTQTPIAAPAKPAVWRSGTWFLRNTLSSGPADIVFLYGLGSDTPLMCDWDGNGSKTPGVVRNGIWYLRNANSGGNADLGFAFGLVGDIPLCGDWDGDGDETPGVFRSGTFYLRNANSGGPADLSALYGAASDTPLAGDWDGNGTDTIGVFRSSNAGWFLKNSNSSGVADIAFVYGVPGDLPTVGDWDGNGTDTAGIVRSGVWYLRNSHSGGSADLTFSYGASADVPHVWR